MSQCNVVSHWMRACTELFLHTLVCDSDCSPEHDDVIKWNLFPLYWPFVRRIHRSSVNSPHKGPVVRTLMLFWCGSWLSVKQTIEWQVIWDNKSQYDVIVFFSSYPKLKPPSFFCESESRHGLVLHYRSKRRGFVYYVMGQVTQLAKAFYNTPLEIEILSEEENMDMTHVVSISTHVALTICFHGKPQSRYIHECEYNIRLKLSSRQISYYKSCREQNLCNADGINYQFTESLHAAILIILIKPLEKYTVKFSTKYETLSLQEIAYDMSLAIFRPFGSHCVEFCIIIFVYFSFFLYCIFSFF